MIVPNRQQSVCRVALACAVCLIGGCRSDPSLKLGSTLAKVGQPSQTILTEAAVASHRSTANTVSTVETPQLNLVSLAQFNTQVSQAPELLDTLTGPVDSQVSNQEAAAFGSSNGQALVELVDFAIANHPEIRRLRANTREAWARVPQLRALPDPMARGSVFGEPMMMVDGQTRGTLMISQTLPYLKRLDARAQQASFEAMINQQIVRAAEQRIAADVREAWYRLYLLEKLLQINEANEQLIRSLVSVATAQVEVGRATSGDVILGTVELSRTEEERLQLRQQLALRKAIFNQLLNRPADSLVTIPDALDNPSFELSLETLREIALNQQAEIALAQLRTQATAWGVQIAKLERVPDLTLNYEHMFMRMNPGMSNSDPWQIGAGINIPLWHQKYAAMRQEASWKHCAAHLEIEEVIRANEVMLLDYNEQVRAADRTARLYLITILPQIRQGFEADQRAYEQGAVQFERVIANARNLLTAESAYYRALTDKAIALARLEQTVGGPLPVSDQIQSTGLLEPMTVPSD
ncbi:MAG: TolC family protein [Pirellulaceae bacterium]|nr:TolC family protein [Pirellulaceae bacterium]